MKALLAAGAKVDVAYDVGMFEGGTALVVAAMAGQMEIASLLIDAGADVNVEMSDGKTALHAAAMLQQAEVGSLLLEKGAAVDARDWYGMTPLMQSAMAGDLEFAKLLVSKGANVNAISDGTRARYGAAKFSAGTQAAEEAQAIEKSGKLQVRQEDGLSVLQWARGSNKELVDFLKKAGAK